MSRNIRELFEALRHGDRRALARAITIVETQSEDRIEGTDLVAAEYLSELVFGCAGRARVVGITGAPGAGKSTLVDSLIAQFRQGGESVGIIAVDPTSPFSGGAILGDRVRMQDHLGDASVFVRSMATRGSFGGLSVATPDAIRILDVAGFDIIIVETVGVGQVEVDIADVCDLTVVVLNPGWGDSVQTAKAGLMEIGNMFVINKADKPGVDALVSDLKSSLELSRSSTKSITSGDVPEIYNTVAIEGLGVSEFCDGIRRYLDRASATGEIVNRRSKQLREEITRRAVASLLRKIQGNTYSDQMSTILAQIVDGKIGPARAARLLEGFIVQSRSENESQMY